MKPHFFDPHPLLKNIVSTVCIAEINLNGTSKSPDYLFPWSTQVRLCFYIHGGLLKMRKTDQADYITASRSFVVGPQLTSTFLHYGSYCMAMAVCFHAGGIQRLLRIPVQELVNKELDAHLIFGNDTYEIEERIRCAGNISEVNQIVQQFLVGKIKKQQELLPFDFAINELVKNSGNLTVEETASLACLSIRQFERKCNEYLGMPPKLFGQLVRFSKAYALKENKPHMSWSKIAFDCGYHDQMHLLRNFKIFTDQHLSMLSQNMEQSIKAVSVLEIHH